MKSSDSHKKSLDREVKREREERHKNDEARAGVLADDDFRVKDARESNFSAGELHRVPGH